ncbi:MAG: hypothetical protein GY721_13730, partial [Deltaproteobacteria bacterium]|nr:hypothetical protein [Deltaproteobacteria bacterium]
MVLECDLYKVRQTAVAVTIFERGIRLFPFIIFNIVIMVGDSFSVGGENSPANLFELQLFDSLESRMPEEGETIIYMKLKIASDRTTLGIKKRRGRGKPKPQKRFCKLAIARKGLPGDRGSIIIR